ncbi:MAG: D-alanyl-D-alanine carboxypeptidase/D-alanyl-D-alanine-endopeptidase [Kineosporiaceae bacterium]
MRGVAGPWGARRGGRHYRPVAPPAVGAGLAAVLAALLLTAEPAPGVVLPLVTPTAPAPGDASLVVPPALAGPVLEPLTGDAPAPDPAVLSRDVAAAAASPALGPAVGYLVTDVVTGAVLASREAAVPREPASTAKLLTAVAALSALGPDATLDTRVVAGTGEDVVLVGGGDVLLGAGAGRPQDVVGRAGLADLAAATASALRAAGRTRVAVRLDDTAFPGPASDARWADGDLQTGYVAPVMALEVDAGRLRPGPYGPRQPDPALAAAGRFAALLAARGVQVIGAPSRAGAAAGARELARVSSAPVADVVEHMLLASENTVAEALARLVARAAGRPGTALEAGPAVLARLAALGLPVAGARLAGGSGLADGSALTPALLTRVLALAAAQDRPQLRAAVTGLPVAGASGTLATRFDAPSQRPGAGLVRAKTGTLTGVTSLAGLVTDADGRLLAFAVMADRTGPTPAARDAVDTLAAVLAGCGCR